MTLSNVVDELHDKHRLTHTGTSEESDLTTLQVRLQQVDDLDTGCQHLLGGREFLKLRSLTVDGISTLHGELFHTVDRLTDHVQHTTLNLFTRGHHDRCAQWYCFQSTLQTVGIVHSHTANGILTDVLLHLDDNLFAVRTFNRHSFVNLRQHFFRIQSLGIEIHVDHRTDNLRNVSINL